MGLNQILYGGVVFLAIGILLCMGIGIRICSGSDARRRSANLR